MKKATGKSKFTEWQERCKPSWIGTCKVCNKDTYNQDKTCDWCKQK